MKLKFFLRITFILFIASCSTTRSNKEAKITQQRPPVKCMEDSPERRGEEGCTILANRPFVGPSTEKLYWHIDRFDGLEAAKKAAGPDAVAVEAHGSVWLLTVEGLTEDHHGGNHITSIGPLVLPDAKSYFMRVQSSILSPGSMTPVHTHSGPEVIYVVDGEQCMDTQEVGHRIGAGQFILIPSDVIHRGRVPGSSSRRAIALILYDADRPASTDLPDSTALVQCK